MTEPAAEVRVRIIADDQSAETLERSKDHFHALAIQAEVSNQFLARMALNIEHVSSVQQAAANKGGDISKEILKGNLYFEAMKKSVELVSDGVREAWELTEKLGEAALEASEAAEEQEKQMAGYLFLIDGGKHSMQELREYTRDQREEFEKFAVTAGVATKDLVAMYDKLIERGVMGSEQAKELAQQMAVVGKIIPGGGEALAQGMSALEQGMARPRNPIVQLIAATHMLQGNARAVSQQMMHMTPAQQMELAQKAIERQAEALKKMGEQVPDLKQLRASFDDIKEGFLEAMGQPMMGALIPQLVRLRDFLSAHSEELKAFAEKLGYKLADVINYLSAAIEGIYDGLAQNWDYFASTFHEIFSAWEVMWGNSKKTTTDIKAEFQDVGVAMKEAFLDISRIIEKTLSFALGVADALHGQMPGTTRANMAGNAAVDASLKPTTTADAMEKAIKDYTERAAGKVDPAEVDKRVAFARENFAREQQEKTRIQGEAGSQNWEMVNAELQGAKNNGDEEMVGYILRTVAATKEGAEAIEHHNVALDNSFGDLKRIFDENIPEIAKAMREGANKIKQEGGITAPKPTMVFTGPIHIKQDFKDQDPDRVLLTFKKDLAQAAANRTTSRNAALFGM